MFSVLDTQAVSHGAIDDTRPVSPDPSGTSVAVAFCPHPPLLLPGLAGTPRVAVDRLRVACGEAVQTVLGLRPDVVLVVGQGPAGVRYGAGDSADLGRWGGTGAVPFAGRVRPGGRQLPLAHAVGARLLDEAGHGGLRLGVAPDDLADALTQLPGPVGVLLVGDGAVRSGPAAARFDAAVSTALEEGDTAALAGLDLEEADRVRAAGARSWSAVGRVLSGRSVTARLVLDEAPLGVGHLVADWVLADVPDGVPGWLQP